MARTKDIYELLENNNKEIMVLIYTLGNQPENPKFILNENNRCLEIYRNKKEAVILKGLQKETIEKIKKLDVVYVCELNSSANQPAENSIVYAYTAERTTIEELTSFNNNAKIISQKTQSLKEKLNTKNKNLNS